MTSGTPMRKARSPSSWAKSCTCCTGSSEILFAAASGETPPPFTCWSNSWRPFASIGRSVSDRRASGPTATLLRGAEHGEETGERVVHRRGDDAAGIADAGQAEVGDEEQRRVEV